MSETMPIPLLLMFDPGPAFLEALSRTYAPLLDGAAPDPTVDRQHVRVILTNAAIGVPRDIFDALPHLELVLSLGVGTDAVDLDHARRRNIAVVTTPVGDGQAVADHAMALMLAASRKVIMADRFIRAGKWGTEPVPMSRGVAGRVCGIAGLGRIGQAIAVRAEAFGMTIAYMARSPRRDLNWVFHREIASLAEASDMLVLSLPATSDNRHMVDSDVLARLGPSGILVNVARGSLVDHEALAAALRAGTIEGAALDVFDDEPHVPTALLDLNNLIVTPHIAGFTYGNLAALSRDGIAKLQAFAAGQPLADRVA